jgi:hypothetical protein
MVMKCNNLILEKKTTCFDHHWKASEGKTISTKETFHCMINTTCSLKRYATIRKQD